MIYRLIRVFLKKNVRLFSILHEKWLHIPNKLKASQNFNLINIEESNSQLIKEKDGGVELLYIPKIYKLSLGGVVKHNSKSQQIWKFSKASFVNRSNFIRFSVGSVINPKLNDIMSFFSNPGDADLISIKKDKVRLISAKSILKFTNVFHINGVNLNNWAHFLAEYFPKLSFIKEIAHECDELNIILFDGIDRHILGMIEKFISEFENVKIIVVPLNSEVFASTLYYVRSDTYLGDLGVLQSQYHIRMSDHTAQFLVNVGQQKKMIKNNNKYGERIFIGRKGKRGISNYNEVLDLYKKYNFVEIFPHEFELEEKIYIFSKAIYIAGPLSSGFSNIIFGENIREIFILTNCMRHDDMYLTKISNIKNINLEYFLGKQNDYASADSDFYIDMDQLSRYLVDKLGVPS
jgi:capsular polysaccharide biosynthesis protein